MKCISNPNSDCKPDNRNSRKIAQESILAIRRYLYGAEYRWKVRSAYSQVLFELGPIKAAALRLFEEIGPCPAGMTLDRINPWLGYRFGNLRWADASTQRRNQRHVEDD